MKEGYGQDTLYNTSDLLVKHHSMSTRSKIFVPANHMCIGRFLYVLGSLKDYVLFDEPTISHRTFDSHLLVLPAVICIST